MGSCFYINKLCFDTCGPCFFQLLQKWNQKFGNSRANFFFFCKPSPFLIGDKFLHLIVNPCFNSCGFLLFSILSKRKLYQFQQNGKIFRSANVSQFFSNSRVSQASFFTKKQTQQACFPTIQWKVCFQRHTAISNKQVQLKTPSKTFSQVVSKDHSILMVSNKFHLGVSTLINLANNLLLHFCQLLLQHKLQLQLQSSGQWTPCTCYYPQWLNFRKKHQNLQQPRPPPLVRSCN